MKTAQESKLKMERAVEKYCDENPAIVATEPDFGKAVDTFKTNVTTIAATLEKEKLAISGITDDKVLAKQTLCRIAADTAASIFAYATTVNNLKLKQRTNFTYTSLLTTKDDDLAPIVQNIHDAGVANLSHLATFGITTPVLAIFQTVIESYENKASNPKNAASIKKAIRSNLKNLIKENDLILKEMDKTVLGLQDTYPDFVKGYKENRNIIDPSKTFVWLKGRVISAIDGSPIKGAVISLDNTLFAAISNSKGKYAIKDIPLGAYTPLVTADEFVDIQGAALKLKLGHITILDFSMTPVEVLV